MQYKVAYDLGLLCFSLGCLPLLFLTKLPSIYSSYLLLLILTMIVGISIFFRKTFWIILGVLVASFLWSTQHAVSYLQTVEQYIDQNLTMEVVVKTINLLPLTSIDAPQGHYIDFRIQRINDQFINSSLTIALFWKNAPFPSAGELWQVKVKTKAVHSYLNQGSFDSQRFAMANRKILLGTVVEASQLKNTKNFRQQLVDKALPYINLFDYGDMMLALAFGERFRLTSQHKNVMLQTGIAHLMAISGMHIMLVAYLGKKVMRGLQFFYLFALSIIGCHSPLV
ncbi:ComEC/Rec2 family competence protein [Orbus mooreae]|uniref:ComEC/Rec2 family competence protein n=1 Tax=Orbus mooreae TaxID=3074107 RepID=UPI00370D433F